MASADETGRTEHELPDSPDLERVMLEGLDSPSTPLTPEDFKDIEAEARRMLNKGEKD
jgi:hypothetical protein